MFKKENLVAIVSLSIGILAVLSCVVLAKNIQRYPTNECGKTYGSDKDVDWNEKPDLISVNQDGINGYVYRDDLYQSQINMPKSPEDTVGIQEWKNKYGNGYQIPIYEKDGKTVIGKFIVAGSNDSTNKADSTDSHSNLDDILDAQYAKSNTG